MASYSATIPNSDEPSKPLIAIHTTQCVELKPNTYRTWRFQITRLLMGYGLFAFLDGSLPPPPKTAAPSPNPATPTENPTPIPNKAYNTWFRQDQLILSAIIGTLHENVAPIILDATTSKEAWDLLAHTYANPSRGHILQIKDRLNNLSLGTSTVSEYLLAIKSCTDQLAQLGKPMDNEDITSKIIAGLDYDSYKPVIDAVRARDTPISFEDFHEKLIQHELTVKNKPTNPAFTPSALAATHHYNPSRPTYSNHNNTRSYHHGSTNNKNPTIQHKPFKGKCQFCREQGHVTGNCPDFKRAYPQVIFPSPQNNNKYPKPQAHTATVSPTIPSSWTIDSGASHHVTNDLNMLSLHNPYNGPDDLVIGDGTSLPITHLGSFTIPTSTLPLYFNNVLLVPSISRNLFSVSQFCHDNNALAIFSPTSFYFKEISTGKVLLHGQFHEGTYE